MLGLVKHDVVRARYGHHDDESVPVILNIDLIDDTIADAGDREKIFSTNALALLRLPDEAATIGVGVQAASAGGR
jgi:hypothetical protein